MITTLLNFNTFSLGMDRFQFLRLLQNENGSSSDEGGKIDCSLKAAGSMKQKTQKR